MPSYETVSEFEKEAVSETVPEFDEVEGGEFAEAGEEANDVHAPVSHTIAAALRPKPKAADEDGEADQGDEAASEGFSVTYEAGEEVGETEFESVEGWDESSLTEAAEEGAGAEATVDAWYAGASEAEQQEFFQFLAPLVLPVVKAAIPALAGAAAQHLPRGISQILRRLGGRRRPGRGRETGEEAGVDEAALEAMLQQMEVIIGKDDRVRITNTTAVPWKRICHLQIETDHGRFLGSGALVAPRTVITAGHCVYLHGAGGWAKSITVTPGRNGSSAPFGKCQAIGLRSVRGWTVMKKREYDYGAIILPRGCLKMKSPSAFGFASLPDATLKAKKLNIAGYPGDKPPGTMWYHGRKAKAVTARTIVYDIDTMGGQSGSPVWLRAHGKRTMVAIHTNGSPSGNSATRITAAVMANLKRWRDEGL
jgi:V8-like Glu-specific endopeptidase